MEHQRILTIAEYSKTEGPVIYIMSRDQRVMDNHALLAAQAKANELNVSLVVIFNLFHSKGPRSYEHAKFMLDGLREVAKSFKKLAIPFLLTADTSEIPLEATLKSLQPSALYFDFSPLHGPRNLAKRLAKELSISTYVVDTHNIIPTWVASDHQEFAAHTFRRKVHQYLEDFLKEPVKVQPQTIALKKLSHSLSFDEAQVFIEKVYTKRRINIAFKPGEQAARTVLDNFISERLETYAVKRNDIADDGQSGLSPYLHFGQISSLRVALEVLAKVNTPPLLFNEARMASAGSIPSEVDGMNALFEEMIVRKELSDNFCFFAKSYKDMQSVPNWAVKTLEAHANDLREFIYTTKELEEATTHDELWNAAQIEMMQTGKLHGYMRMYWAKKILEWSESPQKAIDAAMYLNDAYSIDGGDPNGYVGILWSIAGLHDRPWTERPIFGMVRYMNAAGLRRKFDTNRYVERVTRK